MKQKIKFLKKGIRHEGNYIPVFYSKGPYTPESGLPEGTITIYAKEYSKPLPRELNPQNETDLMTDYFETDRARITPDHPLYEEAFSVAQEVA